jgi:predicted kinase
LEGRAALTAYAAIAQHLHGRTDKGLSQFSFTWKLHVACSHLLDQIIGSGHPIQASDAWVERMMRHKACTVVKSVHITALLHKLTPQRRTCSFLPHQNISFDGYCY